MKTVLTNSESLSTFLKKLRSGPKIDAVFVLPRLKEWDRGEQVKITREFCSSIGVTEIKFHDLRATFTTNLFMRGETLARVMSMVGHSQMKTTNGYLRKAGVDVLGGTDKLGYAVPVENEERHLLSLVGRIP